MSPGGRHELVLSVVVPTYRRPQRLERCLAQLARHELPDGSVEVVVVDDGSPPDEEAQVRDVVAQSPARLPVRLHRQDNAGPAGARNAGARLARAQVLAFTDDDCTPEPSWAGALLAQVRAEPTALVGGRTRNALSGNLFAEASQDLLAGLHRARERHPQVDFFASNNIAMDRALLLSLDGFDDSFPSAAAEDRDLCERWRAAGHRLVYAQDALVHHSHDMGLAGFWRQHSGYGRGAVRLDQVRKDRSEPAARVEGPQFYLRLLSEPYRTGGPVHATAVAALIALSQVATGLGYVRERRRCRPAGSGSPQRAGA